MSHKILIVDDEEIIRNSLSHILKEEGYDVDTAENGETALEKISQKSVDLVITDIKMPRIDGITLIEKVSKTQPTTFFIIITAYGSLDTAINALRLGAYDYIMKPVEFDELIIKIKNLFEFRKLVLENKILREEIQKKYDFDNLIGQNAKMQEVFTSIKKVAKTDGNILITGKSGTGKELIARALHYNSNRSGNRFVALNCGAIADTLVESELFGYRKGAFTGAIKDKPGFFEAAHKGTLFLDEIGIIPLNVQAKLLRAIEQKEIVPVGDTNPITVDARIISATNINLMDAIKEGKFRIDLYYRLNVVEINLPPLAERKDDIPLLVKHFIRKHSTEMNKHITSINNEAMKVLINYEWKGEIRELENVIERAIIFCESEIITLKDFPPNMMSSASTGSQTIPESLKDAMHIYERKHITEHLAKYSYNKELTAQALGISVSSLYRKMDELQISLKM